MELLKKIYKNSFFIPIAVIIFIAILIWFTGPYFAFAGYYPLAEISARLASITLIMLAFTTYQLIRYHIKSTAERKLVQDISHVDSTNEIINAESSELKKKFEKALNLLGSNNKSTKSISDIPWYMIIGSPGSGKTTLISNSGLQFPLVDEFSNQAIQGVGGTKNCDWWFTQDAVLLDTAGRYTTRGSHKEVDAAGWNNFLALIKKHRKKPISGVIVSFSLSEILTSNNVEVEQQISQTKRRISELNEHFNTRFPVYVILTKCDMVAGFNQFFESFSHQEREQIFGITFKFNKKSSLKTETLFNDEFDKLIQSVARRQWQKISLERDPYRKTLIYNFPDQLASLKPYISKVVDSFCESDNTNKLGIVRGVYFTSGTQSGAPIDRLLSKISKSFGFKHREQTLWNNDTRSYFIKDLLQEVIFPESEQFGVTARYEKKRLLVSRGLLAITSAFAIVLCFSWYISYINNSKTINNSLKTVQSWKKQYQSSNEINDIRDYLPALNDFSTYINSLKENQSNSFFAGLGLNQTQALSESFTANYNRMLITTILPFVKAQIEQQLTANKSGKQSYLALKAYLMLGNKSKRDEQYLNQWLKRNLENNTQFTEEEKYYIALHTEHLIKNQMPEGTLNQSLIDDTRNYLQTTSLIELYYQQLKQSYLDKPSFTLSISQLAGNEWNSLFSTKGEELIAISKFFTPSTLEEITSKSIANYVTQLNNDKWIIGPNYQVNSDVLSNKLLKEYAKDYVYSWQQLMDNVDIKTAVDHRELQRELEIINQINSPMFNLLESVVANTYFSPNSSLMKVEEYAKNKTAASLMSFPNASSPTTYINSHFKQLHEAMKKERRVLLSDKLSLPISELALNLSHAGDTEYRNKALRTLQTIAFNQPKPIKRWINQLSNNISAVTNRGEKERIALNWKQYVSAQCNNIVNDSYPFNRKATKEASIEEITNLFSSTGYLLQFFENNLKDLVDTNGVKWRWKSNVSESYGFSNNVLPFFEKVHYINKSLFSNNSNELKFDLIFKPKYLDPRVTKFEMSIYGEKLSYQFGRASKTMISWPPSESYLESSFSFIRQDNSEVTTTANGLFSIFRLFDDSEVNKINSNRIEITFSKESFDAIYEISSASSKKSNPMIFETLSNFKCLNSL